MKKSHPVHHSKMVKLKISLLCCTIKNYIEKFSLLLRNGLPAEAAIDAMLLENNVLMNSSDLRPCQQFFGKGKRKVLSLFQNFGECA